MQKFNYVQELPELASLDKFEKDGERFYILPDGTHAVSVTTMLGHFKKKKIQEWRNRVGHTEANKISAKASSRGTKVHNLLEKYLNNESVETLTENIMPDIRQTFMDMLPEVNNINNIHFLEAPLYSSLARLAGRVDVIAEYKNTLSVIDFKTSIKEKREEHIQDYFLQATAYALMYKERTGISVDQIVIMIAADEAPAPQIFIKNIEDYTDKLFQLISRYHREKLRNK